MTVKTKQHGQFTMLISSDIDTNLSPLKLDQKNIITANRIAIYFWFLFAGACFFINETS